MYYCSLIYKPCLHKYTHLFVSTTTSQNLSVSLEISLSYQAIYQYLLDNPVSRPLFDPTVIAALYSSNNNYPWVATYINKWLLKLRFSLYLDIIDHHDINVLAFHNKQELSFIINIYSDSNQIALQLPHQSIRNLENIVIMKDDFDIRDSN